MARENMFNSRGWYVRGEGVVGPLTCSDSLYVLSCPPHARIVRTTYPVGRLRGEGGVRPCECWDFCRDVYIDFVEMNGGDTESDDFDPVSLSVWVPA
jgi:hypothetical protein